MIQLWVSAPGFLCYCLDKDFKMSTFGLEHLDKTGESCTTPGGAEKVGRRCFESRKSHLSSCDIPWVKRGYQDPERRTDTVEMITSLRSFEADSAIQSHFVLMYAIMKYYDRM